jgi:hypothetical protein
MGDKRGILSGNISGRDEKAVREYIQQQEAEDKRLEQLAMFK